MVWGCRTSFCWLTPMRVVGTPAASSRVVGRSRREAIEETLTEGWITSGHWRRSGVCVPAKVCVAHVAKCTRKS